MRVKPARGLGWERFMSVCPPYALDAEAVEVVVLVAARPQEVAGVPGRLVAREAELLVASCGENHGGQVGRRITQRMADGVDDRVAQIRVVVPVGVEQGPFRVLWIDGLTGLVQYPVRGLVQFQSAAAATGPAKWPADVADRIAPGINEHL